MKRLRLAGVPEHFNYPWELADQAGLYRDLGVNVQFIEEPGGTGAMCQALARGDVDAALLLTEGAVLVPPKPRPHLVLTVRVAP